MTGFFATIYEWFGMNPFYNSDLGDHLRGYDITCTDYVGTPWYSYIGFIMVGITAGIFAFQYYIIDSAKYSQAKHWWLFALGIVLLNFFIAFGIPYNDLEASNFCNQLDIKISDCIGFGFSNAIWSLILFVILTSVPIFKMNSRNCRYTTFWKP